MNEMIEKMITRHAIRRFQDKQIEEEYLEPVFTYCCMSGCRTQ